jgi:hypothetical protein
MTVKPLNLQKFIVFGQAQFRARPALLQPAPTYPTMRRYSLFHPAQLLFFGLLLLTGCQPFDLDRKTFPTCTKPSASIGVTNAGLDVLFYLDNPQGDIGAAGWDPGDGSGSNRVGTRVAYSYAKAGTYTVRLTIVNTCDDTFTITRQITVR